MKLIAKKGVSQLIAWVLILGFAVALGTGVYLWQVRQTEELGGGMVNYVSGILDCQNINLNVQSSDGCTKLIVKNNGFFGIDGFIIRSFSSFGASSEVKEVFVHAQNSDILNVGLIDAEKVEIMPVIKVENELVACKDKVKQVGCKGLDDIQKEACNTADSQGTCNLLNGLGIVTCQECCNYLKKCCDC